MTTFGDALKSAIDTNWSGLGGAEPEHYNTEDVTTEPIDENYIIYISWTYNRRQKRQNDLYKFRRFKYMLRVVTKNDANGEERLDELVAEIERIIETDAVTGYELVHITDEDREASDHSMHRYVADLTIEAINYVVSGATVAGSQTSGDVAVTGDLTVAGTADVTGIFTTTTDTTVGGDLTVDGLISMQDDIASVAALIGKSRIGGDAVYADYAWLSHRDLTGAGVFAVLQSSVGDSWFNVPTGKTGRLSVNVNAALQWTAASIKATIPLHPSTDKNVDMGTTGALRWDDIYADDFVNESPYQKFESPLSDLKKIKDTKDKDNNDKIDYSSLPDWTRRTEYKWEEVEIPDSEETMMVKVGEKTELNPRGFSVNRMVIFLWQALQEATARIEALEAR